MSQQGQWQVAGSAPEIYERELVPAVFGVWAPILVELAPPRPSECVLDVACGTGVVARIAATRVGPSGTVVGIDLNSGMLSVARSMASPDPQSGGQLQWQEASADKLPFPDGSFNVVYCQLGLQFFADRPAALREMRRVLGTEGRLALIVWRGIHESPDLLCWLTHCSDTLVKQRQLSCVRHLGCPTPTNWKLSFVPQVFRMLQFNSGVGPCAFLRSSDLC